MALAGERNSKVLSVTVKPSFHKRVLKVCVDNDLHLSGFIRSVVEKEVEKLEAKK